MGAVLAGASLIIAVDPVASKREIARSIGATHAIDSSEPGLVQSICDMTGGGADVCIESVGSSEVLAVAYASARRGGTTVSVGLPHPDQQLTIPALSLTAQEKVLRGSYMGSAVPRRDIPKLIQLHLDGLLPVDRLISPAVTLGDINLGFDRLSDGSAVRQLVQFAGTG
jgi:alcohol dehydrogenase